MDTVYLIYGEDLLENDARPELYSVWEHYQDAKNELKRLKTVLQNVEFEIEKVDVNQPSNERIL